MPSPAELRRLPPAPPTPTWVPIVAGVAGVALVAGVAWWASSSPETPEEGNGGFAGGPDPATLPPADCDQVGRTGGRIAGIRYLERIRGGADPDEPLPMVILFHSLGSKPEDFAGGLSGIGKARVILPEGLYGQEGGARRWFTKRIKSVLDDPNPLTADWLQTSSAVRRFIDDVVRCRPTVGRPIVTGSSQGGEMAYLMGSRYPERISGVVGVAGWVPEAFWNPDMPPTVGIHGTRDTVVPYDWAEEYALTMQDEGADFEWHPYDVAHAVSSDMARKWRESVGRFVQQEKS